MPFTKVRKINKKFPYFKFAFAIIVLITIAMFGFTGCGDSGGIPSDVKYQTGNIIITGKFAVSSALTASPSLDSPVLASSSAAKNQAPSYALIGPTAEIVLKDIKNGLILASSATDSTGRFQFIGSFRNRVLSIEIKNTTNEIVLGKISANLFDNTVVSISRTNNDIDEYSVIASNIAKNNGMADNFTVSATEPETLLDMVGKLKIAGATYMYQNPTVDLKTILKESSNPQSAVTIGLIQSIPVGALNSFGIAALTPQKTGNAIKITITALDAFANTIKDYNGSGSLAISGITGTAVWLGTGITNTANGKAVYGAGSFINGTAVFYLTNTANDTDKAVTITDSATGKTQSIKVSWVNNNIDHFEITGPGTPQIAGTPFKVTIYAKDKSGNTVTDFTSEVILSDAAQRISPLVTGNFTAGVWQGNIIAYKAITGNYISATYTNVTSKSSLFDVLPSDPSKISLLNSVSGNQIAGAAFSTIQAGIYDTYENLVKDDNKTQIIAERGTYGTSTLKGTLIKTAVNGILTFNDLRYEKAENITIKFSFAANSNIKTETEQLVVIPAAAAKLAIGRAISSPVTSGTIFETQPLINICDTYGNIITDSSLPVTAQIGSIGTAAALSGNMTINAIKGSAEFTNLCYKKAENFTIKFSSSDLIAVETSQIKSQASLFDHFEIIPGGVAASSSEITLTVKAMDANNNIITNYSSAGSLNITGATGSIVWSGSGVTNSGNGRGTYSASSFSNGTAFISILNTAADTNKTITITDSATGKTGTALVSWTIGKADHFEIAALTNQTAGKDFAITITAKDISNNTVTDFSGTLTLNDDTGTITPKTLTQFASGTCSASVKITKAATGTTIQAISGLIQGKSPSITVTPDIAARIAILKQPSAAQAGAAMTPSLQIALYDSYNNLATNDNTTQINAEAKQMPASLKGTTLKTASKGLAVFEDLSYQTAENIIINISAGTLAPIEAETITVTAGAAAKLAIIQQPADPLTAGAVFSKNFKIAVCDNYGNIITGDKTTKITMERGSYGTSAVEGITSRTVNNGITEFTNILYKKAENVSFTFKTTSGPASIESEPYTVSPGAAYTLYILQTPPTATQVGTIFNPIPKIAIYDAYSNLVTTDNSTVVAVSAGSYGDNTKLLPLSCSVIAENGIASFTELNYKKAEQLTLKFTAPGLKSVESNIITVRGGAFDSFKITANTPQTAGNKITLTITALDRDKNTIETFSSGGSLAITGSTGTITWSGTGVTAGNGTTGSYSGNAFTNGIASIEITNTAADSNANFTITDSSTRISATAPIAWNTAALDHFDVTADSQPIAGTAINLRITARDKYSNVITNYNGSGTLSLPGANGSVTWSGTGVTGSTYSGAAFSDGIANISVTNTAADANLNMTITDNASSKTGTAKLSWNYGTIHHFELSSVTANITAGANINLTITARDEKGNIVKNYSGTSSLSDSTGTITPASTENFTNGTWTGTVKITKAQDNITITATDAVSSKTGTSNGFNIKAGATKKLSIDSISSSQVVAGAKFTIIIKALDDYSNPVTSDSTTQITTSIGSTGSANYLKGDLIKTLNAGSATFDTLNYQKAETFKIKFSAANAVDVETTIINCIPAAASYIKILRQPSTSATAGTAFDVQPQVAVCDIYDNILTNDSSITITAASEVAGAPGTALDGTTAKSLINGVATFTDISYKKAEQIKIKFTAPNITSSTSSYITVAAGTAAKLSWVNNETPATPQKVNLSFNPQIRVAVSDSFGNIISTDSTTKIKVSKLSGSGILSGSTEVYVSNGVGLFSDLNYNAAENTSLRFTSGSFPALDSSTIKVE
ncbi:MAG: hypothetical protein QMC67_06945 [Candidatus Wallbacteria bacterium]